MRYLNIPMLGLVTSVLALAAYGSASVYSPVPVPDRVPAVTLQFDGDRAYQHVRNLALNFGSRVTGTTGGQASGDYVADQFRSLGLQVHTQRFREVGLLAGSRADMSAANAGWFEGTNILAVAPGTEPAAILFTAHKDNVPAAPQGALDNASGTATLLELARVLSAGPHRYSYAFAALDAEETGLTGARALLRRRPAYLRDIRLVVNMDMVGFTHATGLAASQLEYLPPETLGLLYKVAESRPSLRIRPVSFDMPLPGGTDGSLMAALGIPVVDVANRTGSVQPGYHNARDTVDQVSAPALLDTGRFVEELVRRGDAMGAFVPDQGFLRTRLSASADPRSPLQYVEPWRMRFAGVCVLLALSLPLLYAASRRPWQHWTAAFRTQWRAWYALLALVLVTALAAGTGLSWTGGGLAYLISAGLLALGVVVTQTIFIRLTPEADPSAGRLVLAAVPPLVFALSWWMGRQWLAFLPAALAAYPAAFVTWRPGAWWRLLDVLLLLPLLLAAGLQTHMAVLLAPLHLFPPVFVPLYAATHASATLAAVWGMFGRRPPKDATTVLTQLPA